MTDLRSTIVAKSDQLNADDLIGGAITVKITGVKVLKSDQPVAINYENDNGKPYKPCKGMRRLLVEAWGPDGDKYVGRTFTLYRDPAVKWAGSEVGGIKISHMSDLEMDLKVSLTVARGKKAPHIVKVLSIAPKKELTQELFEDWKSKMVECHCVEDLGKVAIAMKEENYAESALKTDLSLFYKASMEDVRGN